MGYETLILVFTSIIYEALPFIVLGVVLAGLLEEFVPQQAIAKIIPSNRFVAISIGAILGAVFPMCECGIIVVMRRLLRKGLPLSVCVAYMLAGPVINVVVLTSTFVAFNYPEKEKWVLGGPVGVVLLRAGLAYVIAVITAWLVEGQWRRYGIELLHPSIARGLKAADDDNGNTEPRTWKQSLGNITETALHDFVDIMAFLIIGAALAAAGRLVLRESTPTNEQAAAASRNQDGQPSIHKPDAPRESQLVSAVKQQPWIAILLMMVMAVLFCLCSEADAFVAANFQLFWPPASKLAFMVLGPMLDLKLYIMYTRVFRPRLIFTIILSVVVQTFIYTLIVHYVVR